MELPPRGRRIYIWWVESDQMITFIPYSASKGGEVETTVLWIEDNNSTVGMEKDVIIDLSGCGNRLALGFYERGCGSTREVHRVLRDAVEGYDCADAEFWYQRFFDDMADIPAYHMNLKVHVAQMLLFGHTQLPERVWGPAEDGEYVHAHAHECGYGYEYEHTHGEPSHTSHERHERGQQTRQQYQEYRQGQREQYQQYKEQQKQRYDQNKRQQHQKHSRRQSYAAPLAPLRKSEPMPEPMQRRKSRVPNWREDMIFEEMKAKDKPLYEFCKKNGIKIPKRR
ncbi:hypothetical protein BJY01DRAFT_242573 [Aspergillus pseudoustus]|uniref:Uncharacterized protein n=1 Tax=Aspergillus pseudoustus TaxID=1810923 RepID=A0ABR4KY25_9EURO